MEVNTNTQARTWISNIICRGRFVFKEFRLGVNGHFVDISGFIDHDCLNFPCIFYERWFQFSHCERSIHM